MWVNGDSSHLNHQDKDRLVHCGDFPRHKKVEGVITSAIDNTIIDQPAHFANKIIGYSDSTWF